MDLNELNALNTTREYGLSSLFQGVYGYASHFFTKVASVLAPPVDTTDLDQSLNQGDDPVLAANSSGASKKVSPSLPNSQDPEGGQPSSRPKGGKQKKAGAGEVSASSKASSGVKPASATKSSPGVASP